MSRDDYYRSANFVSDSDAPTVADDDDLLPGDFGGRGTGLAGGYPSPHPAVDDTYAGYDPGMAGCTASQSTCAIAGIPFMGHDLPRTSRTPSASRDPSHPRHPPHPEWVSHGYERDADEYADEHPSPLPSPPRAAQHEPLTDVGNEAIPDPPADAGPTNAHNADPGRPAKPRIGTRFVGHVELIAGKMFHDQQIQARGMRHVTGHD